MIVLYGKRKGKKMATGNQIKKELKEAGIPTKNISVRLNSCSIRVSISDLSIDAEKVEALVNKYESIDRCERTGEILQGGNTFVLVDYDWDALRAKWDNAEYAQSVLSDFKAHFGTGTVYFSHVKKSLNEWLKNSGGLAKGALESVVCSILSDNLAQLKADGLELKR